MTEIEEYEKMLEDLKKLGDMRLHIDNEMLKFYMANCEIQKIRNTILTEILQELKLLRVSGGS